MASQAISAANAILGTGDGFLLQASWEPPPKDPKQKTVTVYLIDSSQIAAAYVVMVPNDCRCVLLQPDEFRKWIDNHTKRLPQMMDADPIFTLAFMLLHEIGHISHGDPGQFEAESGSAAVNVDATPQKDRESAADRFAVDEVQAAIADQRAIDGWLAANNVSLALTNLAWNMAAMRFLEHFGATSLCSRGVFSDSGYTHPNFELRLLVANNLLTHSDASQDLVDTFLNCRLRPPSGILFQRN